MPGFKNSKKLNTRMTLLKIMGGVKSKTIQKAVWTNAITIFYFFTNH